MSSSKKHKVLRLVRQGPPQSRPDRLATEEPLEIRLEAQGHSQSVAVTMRTPGHDFELAAGFLLAEGLLHHPQQIKRMAYCVPKGQRQNLNLLNVELLGPMPELGQLQRHFFTHSACGLCGKASLEQLQQRGLRAIQNENTLNPQLLFALPQSLRQAQAVFGQTGGLHAAALFDLSGQIVQLREDVGRHNALDKLLGWAWLQGLWPLNNYGLLLSGRASFELLQKALVGQIAWVAALGAPSSLAVELAQRFGITLVGFLGSDGCNVYTHPQRLYGAVVEPMTMATS